MFWSHYPWWKHFLPSPSAFTSHAFQPPPLPFSPEEGQLRILSRPTREDRLLEQVCRFLTEHFASQPRLVFHPDTLLGEGDILLVVTSVLPSPPALPILGTIRYHPIGHLFSWEQPIHLVDAFCLHPAYRGKGLGAYLLAELHHIAHRMGRPHALFLKEGPCLPVLPLPMYSGQYVYRRLSPVSESIHSSSLLVITPSQAHKWITIYHQCQPRTLLLVNPKARSQHWRVYRREHQWILACFQETHQRFLPKGQERQEGYEGQERPQDRIGWCTVWLESPDVTTEERHKASLLLSDAVSSEFEWMWMNQEWTGGEPWIRDGVFHWYTYQWTTNLSMRRGYALMM